MPLAHLLPPLPSPMPPERSPAELLRAVASGEERALGALYERTVARVHGLALMLLGDATLAEEVVLEVYVQVWREAERFDERRGSVQSWLGTLTRSRAIDLRRRLGRRPEREGGTDELLELLAEDEDPARQSEARDEAWRLRRALSDVPEAQRRCLVFAFFRGQSHSEVARALDLPLGTVKTRIRSGLSALRRSLAAAGDEVLDEAQRDTA